MAKDLYNHRISISGLNLLARSPRAYKKYIEDPRDEESEALRKGSALDCMLTEPDKFNEMFAVAKMTPPGGMMGEFIKTYIHFINREDLTEDAVRRAAYDDSGFKIKFESVIKKFEAPEIQKYMKFIKDSKGKTILSLNEFASAAGMKEMLSNNEFTKKYLVDLPSNPMIDEYNQLEIIWYFGETECKSILDKVLVDHNDKRIIPIDIKTTSKGVGNFIQSYLRFGYFRQCSFYDYAIRYWLEHLSGIKNWKEYTIERFRFIVADSNLNDYPLIYICSEEDLKFGAQGGYLPYNTKYYPGWITLVESLIDHQNRRDWRYPIGQLNMKGELTININDEILPKHAREMYDAKETFEVDAKNI
jgi:hypothetical protein